MRHRLCAFLIVLSSLSVLEDCAAKELQVTVLDADSAPVSSAVVVIQGGPQGSGSVVLDQQQRSFKPSFLLAVVGQELIIKNSDSVVHGVRCNSLYLKFNVGMQPGQTARYPLKKSFSTLLLCPIHAEMRSRLLVVESALYGVTDMNGKVTFSNLKPGATKVKVWNPQKQYKTFATARFGSKKQITVTLKSHAAKKPIKAASSVTQAESLKNFLRQLGALSKALDGSAALNSWSKKVEALRQDLFIGQGLRSALRQRVGRSNAFRYENRLRWISESLSRSLSKSQRRAVKKIVDESIAYLQSSLKKK